MWLKKAVSITLLVTLTGLVGLTIGGVGFSRSDRVMVINPDGTTSIISAEEAIRTPNLVEVSSSDLSNTQVVNNSGASTTTPASSTNSSTNTTSSSANSTSTSTSTSSSSSTSSQTSTGTGGTTTPKPVVTFSISPSTISSGSSSTLSWSATNSPTSCTASGSWSGSKATSGSASTGAMNSGSYSYTLTCANSGGSASASVNLTVNAPAPGCGSGGTCSLSDIQPHNSQSNCWSAINKNGGGLATYAVTSSFITSHAAHYSASSTVSKLCGKVYASNLRNADTKHNNGTTITSKTYDTWMNNFYIGPYQ